MAESVLDLRAVEAQLKSRYKDISNATEALLAALDDAEALLAHCRALRAALIDARWDIGSRADRPCWCDAGLEPQEAEPHSMRCNRIAALLALVHDEDGPGEAQP